MQKYMPDLSIESLYSNYVIAGVDEVGRGCLAGPLVVGAVIIRREGLIAGINDSKKLAVSKRESMSQLIHSNHICAIAVAEVEEINRLGINPATFLAINRALKNLPQLPNMALVDGNYKSKFTVPHVNVIQGDSKSISIAAASIIAKVYRDNLMRALDKQYPHYNWKQNVGYGTKTHLEGLKRHGLSSHHRMNYKPCVSTKNCS